MKELTMNEQWESFTDNELYILCFGYGIESECVMLGSRLMNRGHVELVLTNFERDLAFA